MYMATGVQMMRIERGRLDDTGFEVGKCFDVKPYSIIDRHVNVERASYQSVLLLSQFNGQCRNSTSVGYIPL